MATATLPEAALSAEELTAAAAGPPFYADDARRIALAWNASRPEPLPVCPRCEYFFESRDCGDLRPSWCCCCEADLIDRYIKRLVGRFGRKGARIKLAALARTSK
jgi:hypothetical protein